MILDLVMPDQHGYVMLRSLKELLQPTPPVIILSVLKGVEDAVKAYDLGATKKIARDGA